MFRVFPDSINFWDFSNSSNFFRFFGIQIIQIVSRLFFELLGSFGLGRKSKSKCLELFGVEGTSRGIDL